MHLAGTTGLITVIQQVITVLLVQKRVTDLNPERHKSVSYDAATSPYGRTAVTSISTRHTGLANLATWKVLRAGNTLPESLSLQNLEYPSIKPAKSIERGNCYCRATFCSPKNIHILIVERCQDAERRFLRCNSHLSSSLANCWRSR